MRRIALLAASLAVYLLVAVSCNSSELVVDEGNTQSTDRLSQAIDDAKAQEAPAAVEQSLWQLLSDELVRTLKMRRDGLNRTPSMLVPPTSLSANNGRLSWTQRVLGDYDNNGEVNLSDLAAIALHFGETVAPGSDPAASMVRIDGDGNGEINLGDVATIAMHFGEVLSSYSVLFSETNGGTSRAVAHLTRIEAQSGAGSLSPSYTFAVDQTGYYSISPRGVGQTSASQSENMYCEFVPLNPIGNSPITDPGPGEKENEEEGEEIPDEEPVLDIDSLQDQLDNLQLDVLEGEGLLAGRVIDPLGVGIGSATIVVPGIGPVVSNEEGYFAIPDVGATARMPVDVICPGYTLGTELVRVEGLRERFFTITLLPIKATKLINFNKGGEIIEPQTGAKVTFLPGDIVDGAGQVITGNHYVSISPVDVSDEGELDSVPGRLEAGQQDGSLAFLETFGMMEIFVDDGLGNKCNIAPDRSIVVTIPIPYSTRPIAPQTVGLYSFDEVSAIWIEEGSMSKNYNGTKYNAEITHLSWWNPDVPSEVATMEVKVLDEGLNPLPNLKISYSGVDFAGGWQSTTNLSGIARLRVRINSKILIKAKLLDQSVTYGAVIDTPTEPNNVNSDSGELTVIDVPLAPYDCSGSLIWGVEPFDLELDVKLVGGKASTSINKDVGYYYNTRDSESYGPEMVTFWYADPGIYNIRVINKSGQNEFPIEASQAVLFMSRLTDDMVGVSIPTENPDDYPVWHVMTITIPEGGGTAEIEVVNEFIPLN